MYKRDGIQILSAVQDSATTTTTHLEVSHHQPWTRSPTSDDSSTADSDSVFSSDSQSTQGSEPTSPATSATSWDGEKYVAAVEQVSPETCEQPQQQQSARIPIQSLVNPTCNPEPRCNPRRTQYSGQSSVCRKPDGNPARLARQCELAQNFVENLVDTSTQMIEVIWPSTQLRCDKEHLGGRNLIGLRTFIQEVLRRSKTSYYTLQVALYYLVLIKPHVPNADEPQPQTEGTHARRAMQCGRRMFLAALILASKYLQDRNYSARAWSKISGLKVSEINSNEIAFLIAVDWNLHIPEAQFHRWSNIVRKYAPSQATSSNAPVTVMTWKQVIPRLTPELDDDFSKLSFSESYVNSPMRIASGPVSPPYILEDMAALSPMDADKTPTPEAAQLSISTPARNTVSCLPQSPRITALPTPDVTPRMRTTYPGVNSNWVQGQAMRQAMQQSHQQAWNSASCESWPSAARTQAFCPRRKPLARVFSNSSIMSSPESMISDISSQGSGSSRTSRSSSISSVAPSIGAQSDSYPTIMNTTANHRSMLGNLNQAAVGSWHQNVICRNVQQAYDNCRPCIADKTAFCAAQQLMNFCSRSSSKLSNEVSNTQGEVRNILASQGTNGWNDGVVLPDHYQAQSFLLSQPANANTLSVHSLKRRAPGYSERATKRQCSTTPDLVSYTAVV